MAYIQLANGRRLTNPPRPEQIDFDDLALGCSRVHRFSNQLPRGTTWTVALHHVLAVRVGRRLDLDDSLIDVLRIHDAHEGVLGDTATPFKAPERRALELAFDRAIYQAAGVSAAYRANPFVKYVDALCLAGEAGVFMQNSGTDLAEWGLEADLTLGDVAMARKECRLLFRDQWTSDPTGYERYRAELHRAGVL